MKLDKNDVDMFYKLQQDLIWYANQKMPVIPALEGKPSYEKLDPKNIAELFQKLAERVKIIEDFARENPLMYAEPERHVIKSWTKMIAGDFFVFSDKGRAIFLTADKSLKAYEVWGLYDDILDVLPFEPIYLKTFLFPFKGKITYVGFVLPYMITFGGGMKRTIQHDYIKAKSAFGVIMTLTHGQNEHPAMPDQQELLKFYLKDERNREEYECEMAGLLKEDPSLNALYHQELGKANARKLRKRLASTGVKHSWYAVLDDTILASGASEQEARSRAEALLPEEKRTYLHVFQYKEK